MLIHIVLYQCFAGNTHAAEMIIKEATRLLKPIEYVKIFHVGIPFHSGRAVAAHSYDIGMTIGVESPAALEEYMRDERHMEFVRFILAGRMLKDSTLMSAEERRNEFINYVLNGQTERETVRDPEVPDNDIVWASEMVTDFICPS